MTRRLGCLVAGALWVGACAPGMDFDGESAPREALVVDRGPVTQRMLLTGQLEAENSAELLIPRTDTWPISIRWMAEDGTHVEAGDRVVEFDNAALVERINEMELAVIEAAIELDTEQAKNAVEAEDKRFAVEEKKMAVAKAELDAGVPEHLQSRREHRDAQLALAKAETELVTAKGELRSVADGGALQEQVKSIARDKALRRLESAEQQLEALILRAPKSGLVLIGEHPFEGRKLQIGDNVWPGIVIAKLPDLSKMVVEAELSDVDEGRIHPGMRVTCTIDAFPDRPYGGTIARINPVAHSVSRQAQRRSFAVVIELDETEPQVMRPGLSVQVEAVARQEQDVVRAPRAAIDSTADPVQVRTTTGETIEIQIDFCDAHHCVVVSGLSPGDELVPKEAP